MSMYPVSVAEAQSHIQQIRHKKGLDSVDTDTADLERALEIISDQLYQESTHFLLELIQNADDNNYANETPAVEITYRDGILEFFCNEVGFSTANVEALCRVGLTTKALSSESTGQKGIGFKSVFKVSNVIWIRSGKYCFKLDRREKLGMIAPIWCDDYPGQCKDMGTSFALAICKDLHEQTIVTDIKSLDPRILMFLRRLRRIDLSTTDMYGEQWSSTLSRVDSSLGGEPPLGRVMLHRNGQSQDYIIAHHTVMNQPTEPKRPGVSQTKITVAFPIAKTRPARGDPSQSVYCWLPIRDYGFKFLLNADFVLTASREDIDQSSPWNIAIRDSLAPVMLEAILSLHHSDMRYAWPRLFPARPPIGDFFHHWDDNLIRLLHSAPILESISGTLTSPSKLLLVPSLFKDDDGVPLLSHPKLNTRYLSQKYDVTDWPNIHRFGVERMTAHDFLHDLDFLVTTDADDFKKRSSKWHSCLASTLTTLFGSNLQSKDKIKDKILNLPLIPLRNSLWTTGHEALMGKVVMPLEGTSLQVPPGIYFTEVDPSACQDSRRRLFFQLLGINPMSPDLICDEISKLHVNPRLNPGNVPFATLLSQVRFLYEAGWSNPMKRELWFLTENEACRRGSQLYVDCSRPHSATEYLRTMRKAFDFVHPAYLDWNTEDPNSVVDWLVDKCNLSIAPRIVSNVLGHYSFIVSKELEFILSYFPMSEVLLLLRAHWPTYQRWIVPDRLTMGHSSQWHDSRRRLLGKLASEKVLCRGGNTTILCKTALPLPQFLEDDSFPIDFLDVPDPENQEWEFLRHFGVLVGSTSAFGMTETLAQTYIRKLQELRRENQPSMLRIIGQYRQLQLLASRETEAIRKAFVDQPLIYAPSTSTCSLTGWFRLRECRWSGIACLRKTPQLATVYPMLASFFCETLHLPDADLSCITEEILRVAPSDGLKYITDLFTAFSQYLAMNKTFLDKRPRHRQQLVKEKIFPIITADASSSYHAEFDQLRTAQKSDMWFIADRTHLRKCFRGIVPILAINAADLQAISHLLDVLGLSDRMLSNLASGSPKNSMVVGQDLHFTRLMRMKGRFISRLLPDSEQRDRISEFLRSATVYEVDKVDIEWSIEGPNGQIISGRTDSGMFRIDVTDEGLIIYIPQEQLLTKCIPFEMGEEIAEFCGIQDAQNLMLLQYVLMESDSQKISDAFSRRGIRDERNISDFDEMAVQPQGPLTHFHPPSFNTHDKLALQSFLNELEEAKAMNKLHSRRWEQNSVEELKPILSRVCGLEKQDASIFVPQSELDRVFGGSSHTHDGHPIEYFEGDVLTDDEMHSRTSTFYPAVIAVPEKGRPKIRVQGPPVNEQDPEIAFLGELHVSQMLEKHMDRAYKPEVHWTSKLRTRAGFKPWKVDGGTKSSTFTIRDKTGSFTRLLTRHGYRGSIRWASNRTFYLEVITIEGSIEDTIFTLHPHQMDTARRCYLDIRKSEWPESIAVLGVVYNIGSDPTIALFVDPWSHYVSRHLDILIESHSLARFQALPDHVTLRQQSQGVVTQTGKYVYRPLGGFKYFRLLQLEPGGTNEPLRGAISTHSITEQLTYTALSYVWGPTVKPCSLHLRNKTLSITASLDEALRSIREAEKPVLVWADGICIDQENGQEKVAQIRLMRDIFQNAQLVYGWLGSQADGSDSAIESLLQVRMQELGKRHWPADLPPIPIWWAGHKIPPWKNVVWDAIDALFDRDWFKRVWITQEVVLAKDILLVCGTWRAPWRYIFEGLDICLREARRLVESDELPPHYILQRSTPAFALGQTRKLYSEGPVKKRHKLLDLFELFAHTKSSLERDKIFGLLALAADSDDDVLCPDYQSSFETVIRRFAGEFVTRGDVTELLYRAGMPKSYEFSSWIPAWTRERHHHRTISNWYSNKGTFNASRNSPAYATISGNNREMLSLSNTAVDTVATIGTSTTKDSDVWTFANSLHRLMERMDSYPTGEALDQVKVMVPIGNAGRPYLEKADDIKLSPTEEAPLRSTPQASECGNGNGNGNDNDFAWDPVVSKFTSIQALLDFLRQPSDARANLWKYWQTVSAFSLRLSHARFFATERGYVGLATSAVRRGDKVVVFQGACVPFVVRSRGDSGLHTLVGECYVHGMMYGEALGLSNVREETMFLI